MIALGIVAYWNSFDVPLVFDDLNTIQRNIGVRFGEFSWNLLSGRSILYLTFTLNYLWSGQQVWSYHLVNLALHLINGVLVFFLAARVFDKTGVSVSQARWSAFVAAALFIVHPVQTESVTYISSRSELLSTAFYLSAFLLFAMWPEKKIGFVLSLLVAIPFGLGFGAKETVISLPATMFLYDFLFIAGGSFRPMLLRWRFYLTLFAGGIGAAYFITTVTLRGTVGSGVAENLPPFRYFLTELRVIVRYVYLVFFPVGLNLDYDFRPSTSPLEPAVMMSFLFLVGLVILGWLIRKRQPIVAFSIFWFFLALAPTSSIISIADVIFEHRLYLPLVGVCLSFPLLMQLASNEVRGRLKIGLGFGSVSAALLAIFVIVTAVRNNVWRDEVRLFSDVVAKSPHKDRAYNSLSWAYYKKGDYPSAIATFKKAIEQVPESRKDFDESLGKVFMSAGKYDEAAESYSETTRLNTDPKRLAIAYNNVGSAYLSKWTQVLGHKADLSEASLSESRAKILLPAFEAFSKCLELDPDTPTTAVDSFVNASYFSSATLIDLNSLNGGVLHLSNSADIDALESRASARLESRESFNDLYTIGKIAFWKGNWARADEFFQRAGKVRTDWKLVYFNDGYALTQLQQIDRAIDSYLQAIRVEPIFVQAHYNVGLLYRDKKDFDKAIDHLTEVLRYDPLHPGANISLAKIYGAMGNKTLARQYLRTVLDSSPGDPLASQTWQQLGL